jgi:imidazole glycerol-phosphate synthase subunit HisH
MDNKSKVVIIDYEMGNICSVLNKIHRAGYEASITHEIGSIKQADKIILPGVGHFQNGMKKLNDRGLIEILYKKVLVDKIPILGICLGMQLFTRFSEEGNTEGLGWLDAETVKFTLCDIRHKVPHMGWNSLEQQKESPLLKDIPKDSQYYFVHSYHIRCHDSKDIMTTTHYGYEFVSAIQKYNIFGTQFHPEKSHGWGEKMLRNFLNL